MAGPAASEKQDVRTAVSAKSLITVETSAGQSSAIIGPSFKTIPITATRQTIAQRLLTSARSTAPVTLTFIADATNLVNLRNQFKSVASSGNALITTFTDFLVKLAAVALQGHACLMRVGVKKRFWWPATFTSASPWTRTKACLFP